MAPFSSLPFPALSFFQLPHPTPNLTQLGDKSPNLDYSANFARRLVRACSLERQTPVRSGRRACPLLILILMSTSFPVLLLDNAELILILMTTPSVFTHTHDHFFPCSAA